MNEKQQEEYLISKGWTKLEHKWRDGKITYSYDIDGRFPRGGLSLDYAVKIQNQYDTIDKQGICYLAIRDNYGYGWKIRYFTDKAKDNWKTSDYTHLNEKDAKSLEKMLNDGFLHGPTVTTVGYNPQKFNLLAIFEEKHGTRYFYVPTFEDLCKVALKVFKERVEEGHWYYFDEYKVIKPEIAKEDIDKYPSLKNIITQSWKDYETSLKYNESIEKEKKLYDKALQDETGMAALKFLESRKNSEYEGFEIEATEDY